MSHRHLLLLVGAVMMGMGFIAGGWWLPLSWLGADLLALGIAHSRGVHRLFGKRADGSLPLWSWIVFLPLHLLTLAVWHLLRRCSPVPAYHVVNDRLVVGRRLLPSELKEQFDAYIDLTAELAEPAAIRRSPAYRCFAILDGGAPSAEGLSDAVDRLVQGRTYIHCAQGYGRTGLFALAILLKSGAAHGIDDGLKILRAVRPQIHLGQAQQDCIKRFIERYANPGSSH